MSDQYKIKVRLQVIEESTTRSLGDIANEYEEEFIIDEKHTSTTYTVAPSADDDQFTLFQSDSVASTRFVAFLPEEELSTVTVKPGSDTATEIPVKGLTVFSGDINDFYWSNSDSASAYRIRVVGFGEYAS